MSALLTTSTRAKAHEVPSIFVPAPQPQRGDLQPIAERRLRILVPRVQRLVPFSPAFLISYILYILHLTVPRLALAVIGNV